MLKVTIFKMIFSDENFKILILNSEHHQTYDYINPIIEEPEHLLPSTSLKASCFSYVNHENIFYFEP